jgi:hypothetical protein
MCFDDYSGVSVRHDVQHIRHVYIHLTRGLYKHQTKRHNCSCVKKTQMSSRDIAEELRILEQKVLEVFLNRDLQIPTVKAEITNFSIKYRKKN